MSLFENFQLLNPLFENFTFNYKAFNAFYKIYFLSNPINFVENLF